MNRQQTDSLVKKGAPGTRSRKTVKTMRYLRLRALGESVGESCGATAFLADPREGPTLRPPACCWAEPPPQPPP